MTLVENLILAVGLAMDAMTVAGARGVAAIQVRPRDALRVALMFGGAQAAMPAFGWLGGDVFAARIVGWGHWVTFVVLAGLGAKMIIEGLRASGEEEQQTKQAFPFNMKVLAALAIATSIDALAAGVTLAVRGANIVHACFVIGLVTAVLSATGVYVGHYFGARLEKRLEVIGGVVLVALGIYALLDHVRA